MKILFISCAYDGGKSGISVYMDEVLSRLVEDHHVTVIATARDYSFLPKNKNISYHVLPTFCNWAVFNMLYVFFLNFFFSLKTYDLILFPAANRRMMFFRKGYTIGVVHDLSQYHVTAKYDCFRMFYIKHLLPLAVRKLDRVIAVSQSTANDLIQFWRIPESKITVNYNGYNMETYQRTYAIAQTERVRETYQLNNPFILYISRIEHPGKNHLRLIEAYEKLPENLRTKYDLILAGSPWSGSAEVLKYAKKSKMSAKIRFIGYVPTEDLASFYHLASLYIFPSLFEGFGLSIAEALACGCVTACSKNSSLGEIAGDSALLFDPFHVEHIRNAMIQGLANQRVRYDLSQKGFKRIELFNWDKHVKKIIHLALEYHFGSSKILGVDCTNSTLGKVVDFISNTIDKKQRKKLAFVNAHCLNLACTNKFYFKQLQTFDARYPDGIGLALAGRLLNEKIHENINGTDLFPLLAKCCETRAYTLYLLGAKEGVAKKMVDRVSVTYPNLKIVGYCNGFDLEHAVATINGLTPDILLVAMGAPKQEMWIVEHFEKLNVHVAIGVGGLFDFYSGNMPRAPHLLRLLGLEWFFRLLMEPRRMFKRYVCGNPLFIYRVIRYGKRGAL